MAAVPNRIVQSARCFCTGRLSSCRASLSNRWPRPWHSQQLFSTRCTGLKENAHLTERRVHAYHDRDPGAWEHSPEWMGSQAGGWGRDEGTLVFTAESQHGNGTVSVTAHAATRQDPPPQGMSAGRLVWQEWRTLRFNEATRQSVAKVWVADGADGTVHAQAECLGMEYVKTMAATAAAVLGCTDLVARACSASSLGSSPQDVAAVCIGMGGGSLPLFLAHHFPSMHVEAVELDPVVIEAATHAMGFSLGRPNLAVHNQDGVAFLAQRAEAVADGRRPPIDLLFLDVFDGADDIPSAFTAPGGEFLRLLGAALHPAHGTLVVNMHSGDRPDLRTALLRKLRGEPVLLIDTDCAEGREVMRVARLYRDALQGQAYVVGADKQYNAAVVASRGLHALEGGACPEKLASFAAAVGRRAGYPFDADARAGLSFMAV